MQRMHNSMSPPFYRRLTKRMPSECHLFCSIGGGIFRAWPGGRGRLLEKTSHKCGVCLLFTAASTDEFIDVLMSWHFFSECNCKQIFVSSLCLEWRLLWEATGACAQYLFSFNCRASKPPAFLDGMLLFFWAADYILIQTLSPRIPIMEL